MTSALRLVPMTEEGTLLSTARAIARRPDERDHATPRGAAHALIARGNRIDDQRGCALRDPLDRETDARALAGNPDGRRGRRLGQALRMAADADEGRGVLGASAAAPGEGLREPFGLADEPRPRDDQPEPRRHQRRPCR